MRQAGRSSPAYRAIRAEHGILQIAKSPDLAAEVTLQPLRELGVDAAIVFADLLLPVEAMGIRVRIDAGEGPILEPRIRTSEDVDRLKRLDPVRDLPFVFETIRRVRAMAAVPCIGFSGAPFTLASYLIEGGSSRDFLATKSFMHAHPADWRRLMNFLVDGMATYLRAQVDAGAQALQLFDSWAGALSPREYDESVSPFTRRLFHEIRETGVPCIHFGTGTSGFLESFAAAGGDVVGVDWRIPIDTAWRRIGEDRGIQGNLDPAALLGPADVWRPAAQDVLDRIGNRTGHVFNLGHGVLPETHQDELRALVGLVHESTRRG